jgi:hypothetical protein
MGPGVSPKMPWGPASDDEVAADRRSWRALEEAVTRADSDPRAFQAVLTRLETDPHPAIRHAAAWWLLKGLTRSAAGRPCELPRSKMKTSKYGGPPRMP